MLLTSAQQQTVETAMVADANHLGFVAALAGDQINVVMALGNQVVPGSSMVYSQLSKNAIDAATIPIRKLIEQYALIPGQVGADGVTALTAINVADAKAALEYLDNLDPGSIMLFSEWNAYGINFVTMNFLTSAQATALGTGPGSTVQLALNIQTAAIDVDDAGAIIKIYKGF